MKRFHCGPARWHVFARGTRRLELFRDDPDRESFLSCFRFALRDSGCEPWAYALLSNHYHSVLYGDSDQLGTCMHHLNRLYSTYHNRKYDLNGHSFDGPYQAFRIPTDGMTLWTLAYVFLNPVKAGLCSAPEDSPWSGYRSFVGLPGSPLEIRGGSVMQALDLAPAVAWDRFHLCLRKQMETPPKPPIGRPTMADVHQAQFEWLLEQSRARASDRSTEDQTLLAVHWARQCGISLRVASIALGGTDLRRPLYEFRKRMSEDPDWPKLSALP